MAREIQLVMLPQHTCTSSGFEAAGKTRPANTVGGDFYDILPLSEGRPLDNDRLRTRIRQNLTTPIEQIGPSLIRAVTDHAQSSKFADDLTILATRLL